MNLLSILVSIAAASLFVILIGSSGEEKLVTSILLGISSIPPILTFSFSFIIPVTLIVDSFVNLSTISTISLFFSSDFSIVIWILCPSILSTINCTHCKFLTFSAKPERVTSLSIYSLKLYILTFPFFYFIFEYSSL